VVVANAVEARQITGKDGRRRRMALRAAGPALAIVTLGAAGCIAAGPDGVHAMLPSGVRGGQQRRRRHLLAACCGAAGQRLAGRAGDRRRPAGGGADRRQAGCLRRPAQRRRIALPSLGVRHPA